MTKFLLLFYLLSINTFAQTSLEFTQSFNTDTELYADQFASTIESEPALFVYKQTPEIIGITPGQAYISSYKFNPTTKQFDLATDYFNSNIQMDLYSHIAVSKRPSSSSHWFYVLSRSKFAVPTPITAKLSFAAINSNGTLNLPGGFLEITDSSPGLQNVKQLVSGPPSNTGYLFTITDQAGVNDGSIGIISRNTLGIPSYSGRVTSIFGSALQNPKHLSVSPDGFRVATIDDNRIAIYNFALGTLTDYATISTSTCVSQMTHVVLTTDPNEIFVSGTGGIRRIRNVGGVWSCPETYFPTAWSSAQIRLSSGASNGFFFASIYRNTSPTINRVSVIRFNGSSFSVLSSVDGASFGSLNINNPTPPSAIFGAPSVYLSVGNFSYPFDPYGFNVFKYIETLFSNGFE